MDARRTKAHRKKNAHQKPRMIRSCEDVYEVIAPRANATQERFWIFAIGEDRALLGAQELARSKELISLRELVQYLMVAGAHFAVLAHNHPGESCLPSEEDVRITRRLRRLGRDLEIRFLDHVIVGQDGFFSFREAGLVFGKRP